MLSSHKINLPNLYENRMLWPAIQILYIKNMDDCTPLLKMTFLPAFSVIGQCSFIS